MNSPHLPGVALSPIALPSQAPIRLHHSKILALFRTLDSLLIAGMLWLILQFSQLDWNNIYTAFALSGIIIFGFFAESNEVYYHWRGYAMADLASRLMFAWLGAASIISMPVLFIYNFDEPDLLAIVSWFVATPFAVIGLHLGRRLILAKIRANPSEPRRVAIVGSTELGVRMINSIKDMPWLGYRLVGIYDDRFASDNADRRLIDQTVEGDIEQMVRDAHDGKIDIVFVTLPMRAEMRMHALMDRLADTTVSPYVIPDVFNK